VGGVSDFSSRASVSRALSDGSLSEEPPCPRVGTGATAHSLSVSPVIRGSRAFSIRGVTVPRRPPSRLRFNGSPATVPLAHSSPCRAQCPRRTSRPGRQAPLPRPRVATVMTAVIEHLCLNSAVRAAELASVPAESRARVSGLVPLPRLFLRAPHPRSARRRCRAGHRAPAAMIEVAGSRRPASDAPTHRWPRGWSIPTTRRSAGRGTAVAVQPGALRCLRSHSEPPVCPTTHTAPNGAAKLAGAGGTPLALEAPRRRGPRRRARGAPPPPAAYRWR
jgi:hypothetical protein